jgi:hypothetical protein
MAETYSLGGTFVMTGMSYGEHITPAGQQEYTEPGTYSWSAPPEVYFVCVVAVGAGGFNASNTVPGQGGGGGGGALAYKNNIIVTPGQSYTVIVGNVFNGGPGGDSSFTANFGTMIAGGGKGNPTFQIETKIGAAGGQPSGIYDGGGAGGKGGDYNYNPSPQYYPEGFGGGGGAGGYSGNGGDGGSNNSAGSNGNGGGGGGGASAQTAGGSLGGGVGIYGEGTSGLGQPNGYSPNPSGGGGGPGSGGFNGFRANTTWRVDDPSVGGINADVGRWYGGGGTTWIGGFSYYAGKGAVRIIWGNDRAFPSTNTANV